MQAKNNEREQEVLLEMKGLKVSFPIHKKWFPAVDGVDFSVYPGEITGIVGESGSGKSVMSQSILRLKEHDTSVRCEGEILFEKEDLLKRPLSQMRKIRGEKISIIFQDPLNSLSPVHTVGKQLSEILLFHKNISKKEAQERSIEMLKLTGIPNPQNWISSLLCASSPKTLRVFPCFSRTAAGSPPSSATAVPGRFINSRSFGCFKILPQICAGSE